MKLFAIVLALTLGHPAMTTAPVPIEPQPIEIEVPEVVESKPLPSTEPVVKATACNCYTILKDNFVTVPKMKEIQAMATSTVGNVAVFRYPANLDFPNGVPHVALVKQILPDGSLYIEEYNYHSCTHSFRTISPKDKRLVGFINLIPLSPSLPDGYIEK